MFFLGGGRGGFIRDLLNARSSKNRARSGTYFVDALLSSQKAAFKVLARLCSHLEA